MGGVSTTAPKSVSFAGPTGQQITQPINVATPQTPKQVKAETAAGVDPNLVSLGVPQSTLQSIKGYTPPYPNGFGSAPSPVSPPTPNPGPGTDIPPPFKPPPPQAPVPPAPPPPPPKPYVPVQTTATAPTSLGQISMTAPSWGPMAAQNPTPPPAAPAQPAAPAAAPQQQAQIPQVQPTDQYMIQPGSFGGQTGVSLQNQYVPSYGNQTMKR